MYTTVHTTIASIHFFRFDHAFSSHCSFTLYRHGMSGRDVQDTTIETVKGLQQHGGAFGDVRLDDGSCDALPGVALGRFRASHGRLIVTYRLVGKVYILLVTEPAANVFLCLQLIDAVSKILVGVAKGIDITSDKLIRRYDELNGLIDGILGGGMAALPVAFVHSSATEERLLAMPTSAADAARRLRKIMGGGAKESAFVTAAGLNKDDENGDGTGTGKDNEDITAPPPPPAPETPTAEQVAALDVRERMISDPLAGVSFTLPPDALPPPPPRAASSLVPNVKRRLPTTIIAPPTIFSGAVEEDEDVDMQKEEGEGEGEEGDWAEFAEEEATAIAAAAELEEDEKPVKPPSISPEDLIQSLQLVEVWRAEVKGDTVIKAGGHGLVRRRLAPLSIYKARFKLSSPPQSKILGRRSSSEAVDACLLISEINPELTIVHYLNDIGNNGNEEGSSNRVPESGEFSARLQGTPMECTYLTYKMPASVCPPPLTAQLLVVQGDSGGRERAWRGVVVVRYAVGSDTALPKGLLDLVIDVDMAPDAGGDIVKCSPASEWCPNQCRLRWNVGKVEAGASGEVRVVMSAGKTATAERATVALKERTTAKVWYSARPGKTLSGVGFEVGLPEADIELMGGQVVHVGEMLLSP
jgi:hypothetical protein